MNSGPRIGIFAHSVNARGGVVHAMQLAEALCDLDADATLLAPSASKARFFRCPRCPAILIPAEAANTDVERLVQIRRREITAFLRAPGAPRFDILHAQDPMSALALGDLATGRQIPGFLRTVHHLEAFASKRLSLWQDEAVQRPTHLFCVSQLWQKQLLARYGRASTVVGNGVDCGHFNPGPSERDAVLRRRLLPGGGRMILVTGGIEARKNTPGILRAFLHVLEFGRHPDLHLVIAGGATLLDHSAARKEFDQTLRASKHADRVTVAGVVDDADMPSLYRNAAMLCFASIQEGFGLCVIEAMASGIPVIVSNGAPFDEHLLAADAIRADPHSTVSIATAMLQALDPRSVRHAAGNGPARAAEFGWHRVAGRHLDQYRSLPTEIAEHA